MNQPESEILVAGFVETDPGHLIVIGRCGGEPIHVGDVFDAIYRYERCHSPADYGREPIRQNERSALLHVLAISALHRPQRVLGPGMTGALTVEGEGVENISPGWVLGRRVAVGTFETGRVNGSSFDAGSTENAAATRSIS